MSEGINIERKNQILAIAAQGCLELSKCLKYSE
jgi:hypothetical protein